MLVLGSSIWLDGTFPVMGDYCGGWKLIYHDLKKASVIFYYVFLYRHFIWFLIYNQPHSYIFSHTLTYMHMYIYTLSHTHTHTHTHTHSPTHSPTHFGRRELVNVRFVSMQTEKL